MNLYNNVDDFCNATAPPQSTVKVRYTCTNEIDQPLETGEDPVLYQLFNFVDMEEYQKWNAKVDKLKKTAEEATVRGRQLGVKIRDLNHGQPRTTSAHQIIRLWQQFAEDYEHMVETFGTSRTPKDLTNAYKLAREHCLRSHFASVP